VGGRGSPHARDSRLRYGVEFRDKVREAIVGVISAKVEGEEGGLWEVLVYVKENLVEIKLVYFFPLGEMVRSLKDDFL